jgi:uncharacterized peroxidase-related enzyme
MSPPDNSSWTRSVAPEQAQGRLRALYDAVAARSSRGRVGHLWTALGLDPVSLEHTFAFRGALFDDPAPLTLAQAEMIALVVSATNGCGYCVSHHGPRLALALGDEPLARAVARDYRAADLLARDRVLLDFAVALTCEPAERTRAEIERLREYGFGDPAIVRATSVAAYYNHVNRVASALGVGLEPDLEAWEFGSQR